MIISVFLSLMMFIHSTEQWLSITQFSNVSFSRDGLCQRKYGLHPRQIRFCEDFQYIMPYIHFGAKLALEECQKQFRNRHWNCTLFQNNHLIGNILDSGTKESAFIHALTSAGIAYAITKGCSAGRIESCGCDMTVEKKNHTGCSDNALFGMNMARKFVNLRERPKQNGISLLNLHNNQIGVRTILSSMQRQCKCFGMSGSCGYINCWESLLSFELVAGQLKDLYDNSMEVYSQRDLNQKKIQFFPKNIPFQRGKQSLAMTLKNDLLFVNASPNYCNFNLASGSWGTVGRLCDRNSRAIDGCDLLCCNRGYQSEMLTKHSQCNCRFQWCCHVQCQNCTIIEEISRCL